MRSDPDNARVREREHHSHVSGLFEGPWVPVVYIDSNTGMLVVSAPNGQTYDVPVNDGYYYVQPDGSVTVSY